MRRRADRAGIEQGGRIDAQLRLVVQGQGVRRAVAAVGRLDQLVGAFERVAVQALRGKDYSAWTSWSAPKPRCRL
jgi:hypothetical protein